MITESTRTRLKKLALGGLLAALAVYLLFRRKRGSRTPNQHPSHAEEQSGQPEPAAKPDWEAIGASVGLLSLLVTTALTLKVFSYTRNEDRRAYERGIANIGIQGRFQPTLNPTKWQVSLELINYGPATARAFDVTFVFDRDSIEHIDPFDQSGYLSKDSDIDVSVSPIKQGPRTYEYRIRNLAVSGQLQFAAKIYLKKGDASRLVDLFRESNEAVGGLDEKAVKILLQPIELVGDGIAPLPPQYEFRQTLTGKGMD